jgi:hypothetical protein
MIEFAKISAIVSPRRRRARDLSVQRATGTVLESPQQINSIISDRVNQAILKYLVSFRLPTKSNV